MECTEVRGVLSAHLFGDLDGSRAEAVTEHLAACEPCRREHARLERTAWLLREGTGPVPLEERRTAILAGLRRARRRRALLCASLPPLTLGAVALAFVAVGGRERVRRAVLEEAGLVARQGRWIPAGEAEGLALWEGAWREPDEVAREILEGEGLVRVGDRWEPEEVRPRGEAYFRKAWRTEAEVERMILAEKGRPFEPPPGRVYWDGAWIPREEAVRAALEGAGIARFKGIRLSRAALERLDGGEILTRDGWTAAASIEARALAREGLVREGGAWIFRETRDRLARGEVRTPRGWTTAERLIGRALAAQGYVHRDGRWILPERNPVTALLATCRLGDPIALGPLRVYPVLSPAGKDAAPIDVSAADRPVLRPGAEADRVAASLGGGRPVLLLAGERVRDGRGTLGALSEDVLVRPGAVAVALPIPWPKAPHRPSPPFRLDLGLIRPSTRAALLDGAWGVEAAEAPGAAPAPGPAEGRGLDVIGADPLALGVAVALPGGAVAVDIFADHGLLAGALERIVASALAPVAHGGAVPADRAVEGVLERIATAQYGPARGGAMDFGAARLRGRAWLEGEGSGARMLHLFAVKTVP